MNNWSDYPIFLAVTQTGSLTAASASLGISQPTVGRRMKALESRFGAPLIKKEKGRLTPTEFGHLVLDHVRRMENEADAITRSCATLERSLAGPITITASEGLGDWWLPVALKPFCQAHPDIIIDLNIDIRALNLAQREADIALRWIGPGSQNSLIGRRVTSFGFGLFAAKDYINKYGEPQTMDDLLNHSGVKLEMTGTSFWPLDDQGATLPMPRFVFKSNSILAHQNAVAAGYGIGMLPLADPHDENNIIRVLPEIERVEGLWVVAHEDLKKSARIRAVFDYLITALQKDGDHFKTGAPSVFDGHPHPVRDTAPETTVKIRSTAA